jgi:hypothetical protein
MGALDLVGCGPEQALRLKAAMSITGKRRFIYCANLKNWDNNFNPNLSQLSRNLCRTLCWLNPLQINGEENEHLLKIETRV